MSTQLILGIGTGRCGTLSLAQLLNQQPGAEVSHERRPLLPWHKQVPAQMVWDRIQLMQSTGAKFVGDVASFYLPYLEGILAEHPDTKVVCLKRDRQQTINSFCRWIDLDHAIPTNHWAKQPSRDWNHDPVWSSIFPKYEENMSREEAIGRYWDEYYQTVGRLMEQHPANIRMFAMEEALNSESKQRELLSFVGIPEAEQKTEVPVHEHSSKPLRPIASKANLPADDPRKCVILVPYQGQIVPQCEGPLKSLERMGYPVWRIRGYAAIDQGRNQMATDALMQGFEETMWIDSDVGFAPQDVQRLRSHNLPITCGIYPQKGKRVLACHVLPGTPKITFGEGGGLHELLYAATGFLHVRRSVYETIQQDLPLPLCNERFEKPMIPFFQPMTRYDVKGAWYLAEDFAFSHRARQCGFKIVADTTFRLWHVGTYAYSWEEAGIDQQRFATFHYNLEGRKSEQIPR